MFFPRWQSPGNGYRAERKKKKWYLSEPNAVASKRASCQRPGFSAGDDSLGWPQRDRWSAARSQHREARAVHVGDSFSILRRHIFCAALGVGGYAAGPVMLAAALRGMPTVVFEPNAEPGFTNRVLARIATRIATAYEAPTKLWGKKATLTGIPVRSEFFAIASREPVEPFHILITGGSQGALAINRTLVDSADLFLLRAEKIASRSFTRPENATIMQCASLMRGEKLMRRYCPSSETWRNDLRAPI